MSWILRLLFNSEITTLSFSRLNREKIMKFVKPVRERITVTSNDILEGGGSSFLFFAVDLLFFFSENPHIVAHVVYYLQQSE